MEEVRATNELERGLRMLGFSSYEDYQRLLGRVDLGTPTGRSLFDAWVLGNGTKAGLLEVIRLSGGGNG